MYKTIRMIETESRDFSSARRNSNRDGISHSGSRNKDKERELMPDKNPSLIQKKNEQIFDSRSHMRSNDMPDQGVHGHASKGMDGVN